MPEELKAMAEKYAQAAAELEANAEDDPLGDYFLAIGIEKTKKKEIINYDSDQTTSTD